MKNVLDQNFASVIVFFISPVHWFHISQQDIVRYNGAKMCQLNHDLVKVKELFFFLLYFQKHVLLSLWRLHNVQCTSLLQYICRGNALKTLLTDVRIVLELRAV